MSKYSTVTGSMSPLAPACVSVAGRLALSSMVEVGSTATEERLIWIGTSPDGAVARLRRDVPLVSAGQPISTRRRGRAQVAVGVGQERAGRGQHERQVRARRPFDRGGEVTGRKPRPVIAMSVAFEVVVSAPLASMSQIALVLTPPAVNQRPPPTVFGERDR